MGQPIKILSMDGGNGFNTAELLTQLENVDRKAFLDETDIFAGTSAGGINALFLAASDSPTAALVGLKDFWNNVNASILQGLHHVDDKELRQDGSGHLAQPAPASGPEALIRIASGVSLAALGLHPLFHNHAMKTFLLERFGDMRLGDLTRYPVVIVTLQLDHRVASQSSDERSWGPKLYTNLPYRASLSRGFVAGDIPNPDINERVVDVAMRTSAAPLQLPIYQSLHGADGLPGFVDGGLVANNPSMIALAAIVGSLANGSTNQRPQSAGDSFKDIWMLSVGTGRNLIGTAQYLDPEFSHGSAPWGYQKWLFDPSSLLVLVDAFLQGGNEAAAFQARILLGDDHFNRLNVPIKDALVADDERVRTAVAATAAWLRDKGWMRPKPLPAPAIPLNQDWPQQQQQSA
jgi:hypothetical protein